MTSIETPRVYIHGFPPLTTDQWEDLAPKSLWTQVYNHDSGGSLWTGGTDDDHDLSYIHMNPPVRRWQPDITKDDFDAVVTLYATATPPDWFVAERRFPVMDSDMRSWSEDMYVELADLIADTHYRLENGQKVLVRCQAGINRSGLITALVLIREGLSAQQAIDLIREKRSRVCLANSEFVKFLHSEKALDIAFRVSFRR